MRLGWIVLALIACKKAPDQVPLPATGSGSATVTTPVDAQLVDMAAPPDAGAQLDTSVPDRAGPAPVDADKLLDVEAVGPLRWRMPEADAVKALGPPMKKTLPVEEAATGEFASTWTWPGVTLEMVSDTRTGPTKVRLIHLEAKTAGDRGATRYATARGITLGSTRAEVAAAYPRSDEGSDDPAQFLVGSPYGGLLFLLEKDTVAEILLGPMAF